MSDSKIMAFLHTGVLVLTVGLLIASAAVPYWYKFKSGDTRVGLFEYCSDTECQKILSALTGTCEEKFKASQAFIIISCIVVGLLAILSILRLVVDAVKSIPLMADMFGAFVASVCIIIPWTIAVDVKDACVCKGGTCDYHVSFAFAVISWILMLLLPVFVWFTQVRNTDAVEAAKMEE